MLVFSIHQKGNVRAIIMKIISVVGMILCLVATGASAAGNIARSSFTTNIENREPVDKVGQLTNDNEKIYFFTEIVGMSGHKVTHRWEHAGDVKAEITFDVGSDRWRVWSSKNLQPQWTGEWIVTVLDDAGTTLAEESMAYVPQMADKADAPAMEPAAAPADMPAAQ
jgi:hypothetical protein